MNKEVVVFWFRRDLRLEDNNGLHQALSSGLPVLPVFIFDKNILNKLEDKKDRRVHFIHESLSKIQSELTQVNSSLLIIHDIPQNAFSKITNNYKVRSVFTNHDYEPYANSRDKEISIFLENQNISFKTFKDQVIFEKSEVVKSDGKPYTIFTPFSRVWKQHLKAENLKVFPSASLTNNFIKTNPLPFPSLEDLGFQKSDLKFPSLDTDENILLHYTENRNTPSVEGTSRMGIHLRFGTISVRSLAKKAVELNETFLNELIWREFFMCILHHFPNVINQSFKKEYDNIVWQNDESNFKKWCEGKTGYPIVDAGMRQLNETGWMHNRVRMIVASFLTKHLLIDWRWGEAYFAEKLIDYELSANNGNWQWAAGCGCDAAPYFRIFNPSEQTKKFDPELKYIKNWVKEIDTFDYPSPIVDHKFARERVLITYKKGLGRN